MAEYVDIVMANPPGPDSDFIEAEDQDGNGVNVGEWIPPSSVSPYWRLRIMSDRIESL